MTEPLRIGNASGFYGDRASAWQEMLDGGDLDVLTGDYLAELTMLILGRDRLKDPSTGYAKSFLRQLEAVLGTAKSRNVRLVANAGGLNPAGLAAAIRALAERLGLDVAVAHVEGDDVTARIEGLTANAYLGAFGIAECLKAGADVVVTGRVTDASLVVGPGIAHFGWTRADLDQLAGATAAGHVLECGTQATGGNYAFFTELPDSARRPGFPLAELHSDGSAVITKHPGTGGAVTVETVTAQLLYEIGTPTYLGPDVVTDFTTIRLTADGPDRVRIEGVRGTPPPPDLKIGVNTLGGFRNAMTFVLCGLQIPEKAALVQAQLTDALGADGLEFTLARTDHPDATTEAAASALLTVSIKDTDAKRAGRPFSQAAVELALASYPGLALTAPPGDATPLGVFTAAYLPQGDVDQVAVLPDGTRKRIPAPTTTATHNMVISPKNPDREASGFFATPPATRRAPLGELFGARSGDKGGDANIGVWARNDRDYEWLRVHLTAERLQELLPETGELAVERHELENLRAVNFVVRGILGDGVAASTRFDPQGKALGEWLRSRIVDLPL
ncbi:acyclic terpene utilization AtuA family protein [Dactylosporangium sp. NPDC051541]|uniref:acyclic terpene utilization AtuA family protein n=1 Tax=Dactylosporangium sp. NPDC051541 TaxID=3363977 RepID=UPI0037B36BCE